MQSPQNKWNCPLVGAELLFVYAISKRFCSWLRGHNMKPTRTCHFRGITSIYSKESDTNLYRQMIRANILDVVCMRLPFATSDATSDGTFFCSDRCIKYLRQSIQQCSIKHCNFRGLYTTAFILLLNNVRTLLTTALWENSSSLKTRSKTGVVYLCVQPYKCEFLSHPWMLLKLQC